MLIKKVSLGYRTIGGDYGGIYFTNNTKPLSK